MSAKGLSPRIRMYLGIQFFMPLTLPGGSDNGVNFNFHPENEAEAGMYIAGLIPYIRDTMGKKNILMYSWQMHQTGTQTQCLTHRLSKSTQILLSAFITHSP